ncbi:TrmO family methyltransferase [Rhodosalinus sp.]|uniref:TrmO family methyltransferase domain-containing protein n=1 Tax=Rhodosalinus sp. TaxID=2047741 RepID=UPI00356A2637
MSRRAGEEALGVDPAAQAFAGVTAIGRLRSEWRAGDCPRNLRQARDRGGGGARLEIDAPYRPGLRGLAEGQWIWLLAWYGDKRRDLIVQAPAHAAGPRGTFALRSPVRPNPVALQLVRITALEADRGHVAIDATDAFDGTPLLDIKPWLDTVDTVPDR